MGKVIIPWFSGTGNTRRAAGILEEEFRAAGLEVEAFDLAAGREHPRVGPGELLVLCFPALGFSAPSLVQRYARRLRGEPGARAAVLCCVGATWSAKGVTGGWAGIAVPATLALLESRGFEAAGGAEASYPENWSQVSNPAEGEARDAMLARGDADARAFALDLREGRRRFVRRGPVTRLLGPLFGLVFRSLARRALARLYIADSACTACGLCARSCPAGAIAMREGKPAWRLSCVACNRCINACPEAAIQSSWARLVLVLGLNFAAVFAAAPLGRLARDFLMPGLPGPVAGLAAFLSAILAFVGLTFLQLGPLDAAIRKLERMPSLAPIFRPAPTRGFRRYLAPGFKPGASAYRKD